MSKHPIEPRLIGTDGLVPAATLVLDGAPEEQQRATDEVIRKQSPTVEGLVLQVRAEYEWLSLIGRPENAGGALLPCAQVHRATFPVEDRDDKWGEYDYSYPVTLCDVAVSNPLPGTAQLSIAFGDHTPAVQKTLQQGEIFWCRFHDESGDKEEAYKPKPHEIFIPDMHALHLRLLSANGILYEGLVEPGARVAARLTLQPRNGT